VNRILPPVERPVSSVSTPADDARRAALNLAEDAVQSRQVAEALNVELRGHAAQFESLLNAVPLGVYLVDADFRFRHVSPTTSAVLGGIPDLIGRDFDEVIHLIWPATYADDISRLFRRTLDTGEPYTAPLQIEQRIDRDAAEVYDWQIHRIPLPEGGYGVVCYFREVSDRVRAEQQIQDLLTELEQASRRKDEFLAMLAHELRGPLAPISNALEIMQRSDGNPELLPQLRATMQRQMAQMVRLVDDLLDVSRISRNLLELRKERVELAPILQQALEVCRVGAEHARHQITLSLPPEPIVLYADRARLIQAFGNLLNNACKYTDPGGRIELRVERVGDDVHVYVKDNGVGIPAEMQANVFDMFTQVNRTMDRAQGGLGIGLTLVRRLIELHDGTVQVSSEGPGRGTEFVVVLPVSSRRIPLLPPPADEPLAIDSLRILVADDNHDSATSLALLLQVAGHQTQIAHDGLEAVRVAEMFGAEVVVLDIGMPALNGLDACRHIRAQAWGKHVLLVALSGWGQAEDLRKSLDAGFDAHLVKPLDYDALTRLLAGVKRN